MFDNHIRTVMNQHGLVLYVTLFIYFVVYLAPIKFIIRDKSNDIEPFSERSRPYIAPKCLSKNKYQFVAM